MRLWRVNENGVIEDAAEFDDTFMMLNRDKVEWFTSQKPSTDWDGEWILWRGECFPFTGWDLTLGRVNEERELAKENGWLMTNCRHTLRQERVN